MPVKATSTAPRKRGPKRRTSALEERADEIVRRLHRMYPSAKCSLDFQSPYQLLIATILSAQATDARVNQVTPDLFRRYPTAGALAVADPGELEERIRTTGFFRSKARSLLGASATMVREHGGEVPRSMESLVALPGVGRKTANVVMGNAFKNAEGVVVDTHVSRVTQRLGITREKDAEKIEQDLMKLIPRSEWVTFPHRVILHGREICVARKPKCSECHLNDVCPSAREPLE
ncbi:MAG TPA: endonuclease III [Thermoanaerobaculia bacterium]|nr:endonuclease III [Thermoanaerobaculia bacterium]